jgi:hypothetical protein
VTVSRRLACTLCMLLLVAGFSLGTGAVAPLTANAQGLPVEAPCPPDSMDCHMAQAVEHLCSLRVIVVGTEHCAAATQCLAHTPDGDACRGYVLTKVQELLGVETCSGTPVLCDPIEQGCSGDCAAFARDRGQELLELLDREDSCRVNAVTVKNLCRGVRQIISDMLVNTICGPEGTTACSEITTVLRPCADGNAVTPSTCLGLVDAVMQGSPCNPNAPEPEECALYVASAPLILLAVPFIVIGLASTTADDPCAELAALDGIPCQRDADLGQTGVQYQVEAQSGLPHSAGAFDSIFPTLETDWNCVDGTQDADYYCQTDNKSLTYYMDPALSADGKTNIKNALDFFNSTDLNVGAPQSALVRSGGSETDVYYAVDDTLEPPMLGQAWCDDAVGRVRCDQHYVVFKHPTPGQDVACHETGHTVGLTHGQQAYERQVNGHDVLACMTTPIEFNYLGAHNKGQINETY